MVRCCDLRKCSVVEFDKDLNIKRNVIRRHRDFYEFRNVEECEYYQTNSRKRRVEEFVDKLPIHKRQRTVLCDYVDFENASLDECWDLFNKYHSSNNNDDIWVTGTKVKNYLLRDPILDWFDKYYSRFGLQPKSKKQFDVDTIKTDKEKNSLSMLYELGIKFEDEVVKELNTKYTVKTIINDIKELSKDKMVEAFNEMEKGTPILAQVPLYNELNKTYGIADLIIRSDYFNKIFKNVILEKEEERIRAPNLNGRYHYRVIDIKWTTIYMCSNGKHILNRDRMLAYKGQLAIYNAALGHLQGYTPNKAYILGKCYTYKNNATRHESYDCFNRLGEIDYETFDKKYLNETTNSIIWIRNLIKYGNRWRCLPKPTVYELYPNMCNKNDAPFGKQKKQLSESIKELTSLWMVGPKNRKIAHNNNVYRWDDDNCTAELLGIKGSKTSPILNKIIEMNKGNIDGVISPLLIENNHADWQTESEMDFYIDFETVHQMFVDTKMDIRNGKMDTNVIFLIGIWYLEDKIWVYKKFFMETFTREQEKATIDKFKDFIEDRVSLFMKKHDVENRNLVIPRFFHWGHAERTMLDTVNRRHNDIYTDWLESVCMIDFCDVFKSVPIVIKGAKKFGLKEVAQAMYKHKMIGTKWDDSSVCDGFQASLEAAKYYKFIERYQKMTPQFKRQVHRSYVHHTDTFKDIIKYNEIDCKVLWEIVSYLRANHAHQRDDDDEPDDILRNDDIHDSDSEDGYILVEKDDRVKKRRFIDDDDDDD